MRRRKEKEEEDAKWEGKGSGACIMMYKRNSSLYATPHHTRLLTTPRLLTLHIAGKSTS
jgi:hypothetical protein